MAKVSGILIRTPLSRIVEEGHIYFMLAYIQGTIISRGAASLIVRAGDLGYRIFVPEDSMIKKNIGDDIALFLHQHIRENAEELYGFSTEEEYMLFEHLLSVSGVGPKSALAVLRIASVPDIISAIGQGDPTLLKKVSGIGTKTAERIVVELKATFQGLSPMQQASTQNVSAHEELIDALVRMGYARVQAQRIVQAIPGDLKTVEEKLTYALRNIA